MSIASEIQDLNTNLTAAKNAVTTKGGTVGDTGLAGLASEIASIPSGGSLSSYGTLTYLDSNNLEQTVELATEEDLFKICTNTPYGTLLTIGEVSFEKSRIRSVTIADGVTFIPDHFLRNVSNSITVNLPNTIVYIGSYFCSNNSLMNELNLPNVEYIGDYFCYAELNSYTHPINLPKVEYIGSNFLQNWSSFNGTITLNSGCRVIGAAFMSGCWNYDHSLIIPSGLEDEVGGNPGNQFMYNCRKFVGPLVCNGPVSASSIPTSNDTLSTSSSSAVMYTTGVTLTGPYAEQWKAALPDRTSSPYRKLIIGS